MSYRNWKDTLIGFVFDNWWVIDNQLTGKECADDSEAVEKYAKALGLNLTILGNAAVFSISDADLPWEDLDNGGDPRGSDGQSKYLDLSLLYDENLKTKLDKLKEVLTATGLSPDAGPALIHVNEWS